MNVKEIVKNGGRFVKDNSPHILTGLGVAGLVTTAVLTGQATVKAYKYVDGYEKFVICNEEKTSEEEKNKYFDDLYLNRFKLCWKHYIPPVIMGAVSIACIVGSNYTSNRQKAALAGLYSLTEKTLNDYREKVVEQIGHNKEEKIRSEVAQKKLDDNPIKEDKIVMTGKGEHLCFDTVSGRYFKSDIEKIRKIQNDLNEARLNGTMWTPVNDFYYLVGLEPTSIGEDIGWTVDDDIKFVFDSKIATNGEPCLVISYEVGPRGLNRF